MDEKHGIACDMMHGFKWHKWTTGTPTERLQLIPAGQEGWREPQFLAEVRGLKHKNVAAELLEKLLKDELKVRSKKNLAQSQSFAEKLKKTLNAYHNRAISTMEVIEELITQVRKSVTIDRTLREGARAKIRVMVKRILNKYGYPPDLQEEAVRTVLQQAELLCADWAMAET